MKTKYTPEQQRMLRAILYPTGIAFLLAGVLCLTAPQIPGDLFGLDAETARIMGSALMLAGLSDFALARFLFKGKDRL